MHGNVKGNRADEQLGSVGIDAVSRACGAPCMQSIGETKGVDEG